MRLNTVYFQTKVKILDEMGSTCLVIDFNVLFGLVMVDVGKY